MDNSTSARRRAALFREQSRTRPTSIARFAADVTRSRSFKLRRTGAALTHLHSAGEFIKFTYGQWLSTRTLGAVCSVAGVRR